MHYQTFHIVLHYLSITVLIDLVSSKSTLVWENDNQVVQVENSTHIPIGVVFITFG